MSDHLLVAVVAVVSCGQAIPVGFLLDLPPLETYLARKRPESPTVHWRKT
jgi:hypothetical protein